MKSLPPRLLGELRRLLGPDSVLTDSADLVTYEADGCPLDPHLPLAVVLPRDTAQAAAVVRLLRDADLPIVPRGAGTGLTGGSTPVPGGVVIGTARMDQILEIDVPGRRARVQPGVINYELSVRAAAHGLHFAPDPSSQKACTVGGNIANNSGGPHCLKYGSTASHVLGVEVVLPDGQVLWTGDGTPAQPGYDLTGVLTGSEGTLGLITQAWLRLLPLPEARRVVLCLFPDIAAASATVSAVIGVGLLPAALEIMDRLAIRAVNDMYRLGLPESAGAALLCEVDGVEEGLDDLLAEIEELARARGAISVRPARTAAEQEQVWAARKNAFGAMGRLAPAYYLVDTVVPRTRLPATLEAVGRIAAEVRLPIANVFHAGDGNLHPIVLFDRRAPGQTERALRAGAAIVEVSLQNGGALTGEHGIGVEKQGYMEKVFSQADLCAMAGLHQAFNPDGRFNPGKVFPRGAGCAELAALRRAVGRSGGPGGPGGSRPPIEGTWI